MINGLEPINIYDYKALNRIDATFESCSDAQIISFFEVKEIDYNKKTYKIKSLRAIEKNDSGDLKNVIVSWNYTPSEDIKIASLEAEIEEKNSNLAAKEKQISEIRSAISDMGDSFTLTKLKNFVSSVKETVADDVQSSEVKIEEVENE